MLPWANFIISQGSKSTYDRKNCQIEYYDGEKSLSYTYRPDGLRSAKIFGTHEISYVWDGMNMVQENFEDPLSEYTEASTYVYGIGLIKATISGSEYYYFFNAHGDVTGLVNASSELCAGYSYDAFGNAKSAWGGVANPFRYCGEYYDSETGTYYLRMRYYDPSIGRFLSEDPICDGLNWYSYCASNPVMYCDPWGLEVYLMWPEENRQNLLQILQEITDYQLEWDPENGRLFYCDIEDEIKHPKGNELIDFLINNEHICQIFFSSNNSSPRTKPVPNDSTDGIMVDGIPGLGVDVQVFLSSEYYSQEEQETTPLSMMLGHELIHAMRFMSGTDSGSFQKITTMYNGEEYDIDREEYYVVGIYGQNENNPYRIRITENMLREEYQVRKLPLRDKYTR